jgi:hypothetical protein
MSDPPEDPVTLWLSRHAGVISRAQAIQIGLTPTQVRTRVRSRAWIVVYPGVYRVAAVPLSPPVHLRAALLVGGAGSGASHRSAAWLWGFQDHPADRPTITVPRNRLIRVEGLRAVRSRRPFRLVPRQGLPCTDPIRTLVDCAAEAGTTELDELVDRAVARRAVRVEELIAAATTAGHAARGLDGRPQLAQRLHQRGITGSPNPSVLESRMARLLAGSGLPAPRAEMWWGPDRRRYRLDFAYPHLRLVIEVDGWTAHSRPEQQRWDHERSNRLNQAGWTVLRYDWWSVTFEGERVAREIAGIYHQLSGTPKA